MGKLGLAALPWLDKNIEMPGGVEILNSQFSILVSRLGWDVQVVKAVIQDRANLAWPLDFLRLIKWSRIIDSLPLP